MARKGNSARPAGRALLVTRVSTDTAHVGHGRK
ncbi:hypothetical protein Ga0609869_001563 [Rhodovulum iodosum]|uniref:Uncharacterized protein n=1 Tax=Rhodovulum iodosum TaxID=68291 RepID=A0ABV3XSA1_9RHOB